MSDRDTVLFVCEPYYLRFYRPLADHLSGLGYRPVWVTPGEPGDWSYEHLNLGGTIERLTASASLSSSHERADRLTVFERSVFDRPQLFKDNYRYTIETVRTRERAGRIAEAWYQTTLALQRRFSPKAVFVWNGRYLPYRAVSAACEASGQLLFTSEIGWIPGTIFLDRGPLSTTTTDVLGRTFESVAQDDLSRADAFLRDYRSLKATMVKQTLVSPSEVRQRLLGSDGTFLLLYGCQVDWDTNVVIGARRFHSNEAAISFLMQSAAAVPGLRVVVKTHPLDADKKEDRLRALVGDRGAVVSDMHPHTLIEVSDCVSVRNSTLGFEALCYQKPLLALEDAKYSQPGLTLAAPTADDAASCLADLAAEPQRTPDPTTLRRFIVHALDRYLMPGRYEYFFEPAKLELLSHCAHNQSHRALEQVLREAPAARALDLDRGVLHALDACRLERPSRSWRQALSHLIRPFGR